GGVGVGTGVSVSPPVDLLMPTPPLNVTATAGNGMATVSFEPPKTDGGNPVTAYTVKSHPGRIKAKSTKSPVIVKGLTNGKAYTFTVTATNSVGTGLASGPSNSVTPGE
ncbi:MAG: fibronectin type III domain-containing protein, partial [Syntrophobacteraceae bacterium]